MASAGHNEAAAVGRRVRLLLPRRAGLRLRDIRSLWLPEAVVLVGLALVAVVAFSGPSLDLAALQPFYHAAAANPWPVGQEPFWHAWYLSTPWITGSLGAAGLVLLLVGLMIPAKAHLRMQGMFVLLAVAVGPGLIINAGLKDHWGRPRPREIRELGGHAEYTVALVPSTAGGKSFPCGHCSVGFLYALGWWIWRRQSRLLAAASLVTGVAVGGVLVVDRMAAGGHFLSDGVWAALLAWGVAHCLYYYVLQLPLREPAAADSVALPRAAWRRVAAVSGLTVSAMAVSAAVSWRYVDLAARVPLPAAPGRCAIEITADRLDLDLHLTNARDAALHCSGDIHGFRITPGGIRAAWRVEPGPGGGTHVRYQVLEHGRYVYLDSAVSIRVPYQAVQSITVRVGRGNISVIDDTDGALARGRRLDIDLHTGRGIVRDLSR